MRVIRPHRHLLPLLAALACGNALAVEVTLFPVTEQATGKYAELSGSWQNAAAQSLAVGPGKPAARESIAADKLTAVAEFTPIISVPGEYKVEFAWPPTANAKDVTITVSGQAGFQKQIENVVLDGAQSGTFSTLLTLPLAPGQPFSVKIDGTTSTGPAVASQPWSLGIAALRISSGEGAAMDDPFAQPAAAEPVGDPFAAPATGTMADPFNATAPAAAPANADPFSQPTNAAPATDPFSTPASAASADPFSAAPAAAQADPFTTPDTGSTAMADPFAAPVAAASTGADPFSSPANPATTASNPDPFASGAPAPSNPFGAPASTPAPSAANPFAPSANPTNIAASDPFAAPDPVRSAPANSVDPFAPPPSTGTAPSDPFGAPTSTTNAASSDPFSTTPVNATAPADPFAPAVTNTSTPADPFAPAVTNTATPADPFAPSTTAGNSDPFASPSTTSPVAAPNAPATPNPLASFKQDAPAAASTLNFGTNLTTAMSEARKARRPVFILFSGESQQATVFEKTLNDPKVAEVLGEFTLVRVDYRENRELARKYSVTNFPYAVIINRHGYTEGHMGPSKNTEAIRQNLIAFTQQLF
ncbi:hypothetical protein GC173_01390 [bacterium]|nr:hypothetical protein [bacterium]